MDNKKFVLLLRKATENDKSAIYEIMQMYERTNNKKQLHKWQI